MRALSAGNVGRSPCRGQSAAFLALTLAEALFLLVRGVVSAQPRPAMGDLTDAIRDAVKDAGRQRELIRLGKKIDRQELDMDECVREYAGKLVDLNASYGATRDQFDALNAGCGNQIEARRRRLAKAILAMQSAVGKEEWEGIGASLAAGAAEGFGMAPGYRLKWFGKNAQAGILTTVTDQGRRQRAISIFAAVETGLADYEHRLEEAASLTAALCKRQGATRQEFDAKFTELSEEWDKTLSRCIEARFALKDCVNPLEWKKIFAGREHAD